MIPVPLILGIVGVVAAVALLFDDKEETKPDGQQTADTDTPAKPKAKRGRKPKPRGEPAKPDTDGSTGADVPAGVGAGGVAGADKDDAGDAASAGDEPEDAGGNSGGD